MYGCSFLRASLLPGDVYRLGQNVQWIWKDTGNFVRCAYTGNRVDYIYKARILI